MKKATLITVIVILIVTGTNCSFPTKLAKTVNETTKTKTSYTYDIEKIFTFSCSPCHIPAKGGSKRSYDNFSNVKEDIDEIIRRVELAPTEQDFMPLHKPKLSGEDIALLKKWKTDGLLEK
jgi:mono/diheme cytochrome c family protein